MPVLNVIAGFPLLIYSWHFLLFSAGSAGLWNVSRRGGPKIEKMAGKMWQFLTLSPDFPSIGGCGAAKFKPLRYGPIDGKFNDAAFSA